MRSLILLLLAVVPVGSPAAEDLFPNAGFEAGTLENWTAEGDAFAVQPTKGDNPAARGRESANLDGDYFVGGYENFTGTAGRPGATRGDGLTGTLTSDPFTVTKRSIRFRVGGGRQPGRLGVRLVSGDRTAELATGVDSETMQTVTVDVSDFVGEEARIVVYDESTGGWGHINVDAFEATDEKAPTPEKLQAERNRFAFTGGHSPVAYPETGYDQPLRPQFHFSSRRNWINDPNGMLFDGRRFHLFFQHNPASTKWGNMSWGHAVSDDMVRWRQLDHALLPYRVDGREGTIFSGTAVVDHNDSLGVQEGDTKTICAFFTFASKPEFYQAMAYSTDGGETFTYWNEGRAVVDNQGFDPGERDPKVFWHGPSGQWVMVLWVQRFNDGRKDPAKKSEGRVRIFTSDNLADWTFASDLMRDWAYECMDVVFLPVLDENGDGDPENVKCVFYDASFDYEVGTFDGRTFTSETPTRKAGRGNFYAAQTFNSFPTADGTPSKQPPLNGRCVQIGWMNNGTYAADELGLPFSNQMSFPTELTLRGGEDGPRLFVYPIGEIETLATGETAVEGVTLSEGGSTLTGRGRDLADVDVSLRPGEDAVVEFRFGNATVTYDAKAARLTHAARGRDGTHQTTTVADVRPVDGALSLRLLFDRLSVEAFVNGGESFGTHYVEPKFRPEETGVFVTRGEATIEKAMVRELGSIWER